MAPAAALARASLEVWRLERYFLTDDLTVYDVIRIGAAWTARDLPSNPHGPTLDRDDVLIHSAALQSDRHRLEIGQHRGVAAKGLTWPHQRGIVGVIGCHRHGVATGNGA